MTIYKPCWLSAGNSTRRTTLQHLDRITSIWDVPETNPAPEGWDFIVNITPKDKEQTIANGGNTKLVVSYGPKKHRLEQVACQVLHVRLLIAWLNLCLLSPLTMGAQFAITLIVQGIVVLFIVPTNMSAIAALPGDELAAKITPSMVIILSLHFSNHLNQLWQSILTTTYKFSPESTNVANFVNSRGMTTKHFCLTALYYSWISNCRHQYPIYRCQHALL